MFSDVLYFSGPKAKPTVVQLAYLDVMAALSLIQLLEHLNPAPLPMYPLWNEQFGAPSTFF